MKNYLIVACAAAALVGCAQNRGGVDSRSNSQTGRSETMQSTNSSSITNDSSGAPSQNTNQNSGANKSGANNYNSGANGSGSNGSNAK